MEKTGGGARNQKYGLLLINITKLNVDLFNWRCVTDIQVQMYGVPWLEMRNLAILSKKIFTALTPNESTIWWVYIKKERERGLSPGGILAFRGQEEEEEWQRALSKKEGNRRIKRGFCLRKQGKKYSKERVSGVLSGAQGEMMKVTSRLDHREIWWSDKIRFSGLVGNKNRSGMCLTEGKERKRRH